MECRTKACALAALVAYPGAARSQPVALYGSFTATHEGTTVRVHLDVFSSDWNAGEIVGLNVYRADLGHCANRIRLTPTSIPFSAQRTLVELTDINVVADHGYQYELVAADAQGGNIPLVLGWGDLPHTWVTTGNAPIAHGPVDYADAQSVGVGTCAQECYAFGTVTNPSQLPAEYLGTGTPLLVFGRITGYHPQFGWELRVTSTRPEECTLGVEAKPWGAVKSLYR